MVSVVCPFYNEEAIIATAIHTMRSALERMDEPWELILVDDGSRDHSRALAQQATAHDTRIKVVGYAVNQGRGEALRYGIAHATGDIVVTTEVDLSWGENIVARLVNYFREKPDADIVIASPHLPGGGYRNVPLKRVLISKLGNAIIRRALTRRLTMFTGMTRGYRKAKLLMLALEERGKELHLEIINKAMALGCRIYEIPAVLEWKDLTPGAGKKAKRRSSTRLGGVAKTHLLFSLTVAPFKYFRVLAVLLSSAGGFSLASLVFIQGRSAAIVLAFVGADLVLAGILVILMGVLAQQARHVQESLWRIQSILFQHSPREDPPNPVAREIPKTIRTVP